MNNPSLNEMKHSPLQIIQRFIYSWASKGPFHQQTVKALHGYNKLHVAILVIIALYMYISIDFGFIAITTFIKLYPISCQ